MMKILAPIKNLEAAKLAVNLKADELYVAGPGFSARHDAQNSWDDLKQIIDYAHIYQVPVYITVNILINQRNLKATIDYCDKLVALHPDALIIQDLGLLRILSTRYPDLILHASTQLHIHNSASLSFLTNYPITRCVLARESTLDEIKTIKAKYPKMELEVFIHGALCISYSGQCYYGTYYQQGSGNFGTCEQYCRFKHENKETKIALNLKDLAVKEDILLLKDYVSSLKIEGRLKSLEYLYSTIKFYQDILNNKFNQEMNDLMQVAFNREYTKGYLNKQDDLHNKNRVNNTGLYVGKVVQSDKKNLFIKTDKQLTRLDNIRVVNKDKESGLIIERIEYLDDGIVKINNKDINDGLVYLVKTRAYEQKISEYTKLYQRKFKKKMVIEVELNKPLKVTIDQVTYLSDFIITKAVKKPFTNQDIVKQMSKTNDTPYIFDIEVINNEDVFIVKSQLNQFRRSIVDALINKELYRNKLQPQPYNLAKTSEIDDKGVLYSISNLEQAKALNEAGITSVYVNDLANLKLYNKYFKKIIPILPRVIKEEQINKYLDLVKDYQHVMISELGMLSLLAQDKEIDVNYSLNIINNEALQLMKDYQVKRVVIGLDAQDSIKIEGIDTIKYSGKFPLMIMHEDIAPTTNIKNHKKDNLISYPNNDMVEIISSDWYSNDNLKTNYQLINLSNENYQETLQILKKGGYHE